jgi:hypothetical protein
MLILKKRPQGSIYPQITQAPITNYPDFLNFFRGGHTIDDNLGARNIQDTVQYTMFNTAIASGHLTKLKNMAIPDEFLADIFLTERNASRAAKYSALALRKLISSSLASIGAAGRNERGLGLQHGRTGQRARQPIVPRSFGTASRISRQPS